MNYTEIYQEVIGITNRPDRQAETALAVRSATLAMHGFFMFPNDLATVTITAGIVANSNDVTIDQPTELPGLRGLSSVQRLDAQGQVVVLPKIEIVELSDVLDPIYNTPKDNIAYKAGSSIHVLCNAGIVGLRISYYKMPTVLPVDQYSSWIADVYPDGIITLAASKVFKILGDERWKTFDQMANTECREHLRTNYVTSEAR